MNYPGKASSDGLPADSQTAQKHLAALKVKRKKSVNMLNMQEHLLRPDYLSVETKKNTEQTQETTK